MLPRQQGAGCRQRCISRAEGQPLAVATGLRTVAFRARLVCTAAAWQHRRLSATRLLIALCPFNQSINQLQVAVP